MGEPHQRPARAHDDAKLFPQLPRESLGLRLACSHLAARKLPAPGHVLAGWTLGDEHAPGAIVERCGDDSNERLGRYCHRLLMRACTASATCLGSGDQVIPARQRAVAILVLLTGAARAGLVAPDLALGAHERSLHLRLRWWRRTRSDSGGPVDVAAPVQVPVAARPRRAARE